MARWVVTLVCVAGVLGAVAISVRFGGRRTLEQRDPDEVVGAWPGAARAIRSATISVFSGAVTMALVAGLGGRLFMRIAAATSKEGVQGALTDADELVGVITFSGTLEFVIFFTLVFGGGIGAIYGLLRRYLPGPAWLSGLVVAVIVAGIAGPADFTDPNNRDFTLLEPSWLIALMELGLIVLFGTTIGAAYEWLQTRVPRLSRDWRSWRWYLPLAPLSLVPVTIATVGVSGIVGAVAPEGARDAVRRPQFAKFIGTLAAAGFAYMAATLAIDLGSIAF